MTKLRHRALVASGVVGEREDRAGGQDGASSE
jgi:hypothetical protein